MNLKAFTLIEMLVVISIVGIISSFVVIQMNGAINAGKDTQRKADIQLLANALSQYSADHYNSKPVTDTDGCKIGSDCTTEIEDSLKAYLPSLPDDPNASSSYIYQSDGNDCTISASLSDGTTYQYSCASELTTTGVPTAGVCGSAKKAYYPTETAFTGTYCDSGTLLSEPTFPTTQGTEASWQCLGEYLGDSITCTAQRGKDGVCGTAETTTETAYLPTAPFSTNYCASGTVVSVPSDPAQGGSTTWQCAPVYLGATDDCIAYRGKDGVCGSSSIDPNDNFYLSSEITDPCTAGTASTITASGSSTDYFKWTCSGVYTGTTSSQCTGDLKVDGVCNATTTSTSYTTSAPPTNFCTSGTETALSQGSVSNPTGYWSWGCNSSNGGTSHSCAANLRIDGVCGTANNGYYESAPTENLCSTGTATAVSGEGPWSWNCNGTNGGDVACTANKDLLWGSHSQAQCSALGGSLVSIGSINICKIHSSSCPTNWTWYSGYSTTEGPTAGTCPCLPSGGGHEWSDNSTIESYGTCYHGGSPMYTGVCVDHGYWGWDMCAESFATCLCVLDSVACGSSTRTYIGCY